MKKLLITTALAFSMVVTPAMANFYNKNVGDWYVFGFEGTTDNNRACVIQYEWQDGSRFHLIKDLVDDEIYIWFMNIQWQITDEPGEYKGMTVVVENADSAKNWPATYSLVNKNTILIRNLQNSFDFIEAFTEYDMVYFVMPGNIENAYLSLDGSAAALIAGSECIDASGDYN